MNKKEIQTQYKKKIRLIQKYNEHYFEKSKPLVLDKEYDELKKDILILEKNLNFSNLNIPHQKL